MGNSGEGGAFRVDWLDYARVGGVLAARPAVILPLGGCEPFGAAGTLGVETLCADGLSGELSRRCGILRAPALPFGCSAPFMAFPGAAGVKPRTFVNMLCELIGAYVFQGARRVFLVSAAPFNRAPGLEAAKRAEAKHGGVLVTLFDINAIVDEIDGVDGDCRVTDRADAALLAMAACLAGAGPGRIEVDGRGIDAARGKRAGAAQYRAWKKRGADPQKLRKLFPDGLLLPADGAGAGAADISPERGKELFERLAEFMQARVEEALNI
jgi:creatinine amidohydrolase/Fe(II)-dependent formamide hydrolase-like protein